MHDHRPLAIGIGQAPVGIGDPHRSAGQVRTLRDQRFHQPTAVRRLSDDRGDVFEIARDLPVLQLRHEAVVLRHAPQVMIVIARDIDDVPAEDFLPVFRVKRINQLEERLRHIAEGRQSQVKRIAQQHELGLFPIPQRRTQARSEGRQHGGRFAGDFPAAEHMGKQAVAGPQMEVRQNDLGNSHERFSRQA